MEDEIKVEEVVVIEPAEAPVEPSPAPAEEVVAEETV